MTGTDTTPPIACTLDAGSYKDRLAWIAALNARALAGSRRNGLALALEYRSAAKQDVETLVEREQACCPFLDFSLEDRDGTLLLAISAPEAARAAADLLFRQFEAQSAPAQGVPAQGAPAQGAPAEASGCGCAAI